MYTRRIARPRALRARHSVENQWDLLTPLGIAAADPARYPIEIPVDDAAAQAVAAQLERDQVGAADQLIIVHVSAGNPFRRWPIDSFVEVVAALAGGAPERRLLVTSGPSDAEAASQVRVRARDRLPMEARGRVLAGADVSLAELRALVERAALYVGGDSGPIHIASASRVPILTLYGPTLPARSAPWRASTRQTAALEVANLPCRPCNQRACLPGDFRCLTRIDPREVIAEAERLLH
jgi:ADP-heptose:LPS heptosyltransferase